MEGGEQPVTADFTRKLPKIELHAHLTGSITRECLREVWLQRKTDEPGFNLEDPLVAFAEVEKKGWDVSTFFPLFSTYIYGLVTSLPTLRHTTTSVLHSFHSDGVIYLELRTTPRTLSPSPNTTTIPKETYISTILSCIRDFNNGQLGADMKVRLILSVDRRNTAEEAMEVVSLALKFQHQGIVGVDLCGDPSKPCDVSIFHPAFTRAKAQGLGITLHFAEIPASAREEEMRLLLDFEPDRLGHVVCVPEEFRREILRREVAVELCLSCNVKAGLTRGGFAGHHFKDWKESGGRIVLCTDDVGIFTSPLSNEYLLAARFFHLSRYELLDLCRGAIDAIFDDEREKERLRRCFAFRKDQGVIADFRSDRATSKEGF
ncbi:MAG: hypothetical protein M1840_009016 [Geoglossum simile]|nr:MAG: hypothetical protein M1840_009016 [Geoglossum simile]